MYYNLKFTTLVDLEVSPTERMTYLISAAYAHWGSFCRGQ